MWFSIKVFSAIDWFAVIENQYYFNSLNNFKIIESIIFVMYQFVTHWVFCDCKTNTISPFSDSCSKLRMIKIKLLDMSDNFQKVRTNSKSCLVKDVKGFWYLE